jgi:hypothetical protein
MFITVNTSIIIRNTPLAIWEYASDPKKWTASNPAEHFGLRYKNREKRPTKGVEFHQRESVAGMYADLRGRILYVDKPHALVWTGTATYPFFFGLVNVRIVEGGTLRLEKTSEGTRIFHDVFMQFTDDPACNILRRLFERCLHGRKAIYDHTYRELLFFKHRLDAAGSM